MHPDERLASLITEARWHAVASAVVLPLLLFGLVSAAVLAFGALEMGLATAQCRPRLSLGRLRRLAGSPQAS